MMQNMRPPAARLPAALFALCLASPAARAEPATPELKRHLVGLAQALFDAIVPGDQAVWQRILADDAVVLDEFGRRQDKAEAVKAIRPMPPGLSGSIEIRDPHVKVHGDAAVLDCEAYEQETVFGQKLVVRYLNSFTFVRAGKDAEWKLLSMTAVTLPTQPPLLSVRDLPLEDYIGNYRYAPERVWFISAKDGKLRLVTRPGGKATPLDPIARDVFMDAGDERNLLVFRRDAKGRVTELVERRKFNDLKLAREPAAQ